MCMPLVSGEWTDWVQVRMEIRVCHLFQGRAVSRMHCNHRLTETPAPWSEFDIWALDCELKRIWFNFSLSLTFKRMMFTIPQIPPYLAWFLNLWILQFHLVRGMSTSSWFFIKCKDPMTDSNYVVSDARSHSNDTPWRSLNKSQQFQSIF
jgi:hypothetical protein